MLFRSGTFVRLTDGGVGQARRTRQIGARGIEPAHRVAQHAAGQQIVRRLLKIPPPAVRGVALVVTAPERQRRMVAQLPDHGFRLVFHHPQKPFILRRDLAAEHEILPDHQSALVAAAEELLSLVDVPSPAADHVAAKFAKKLQVAAGPLPDSRRASHRRAPSWPPSLKSFSPLTRK